MRILLLDDDTGFLTALAESLRADGYDTEAVSELNAIAAALNDTVDVAFLDVRLDDQPNSANRDGLEALRRIRTSYPRTAVVMMTAFGCVDLAVEAMKMGADDFIEKDRLSFSDYPRVVERALEHRRLERQVEVLREEVGQLQRGESWEIVGESCGIREIKRLIDMAARDGQVTVLITGPTGTGKELVARSIRKRGIRRDGPFTDVNISALNPGVIESELFGHEMGAFTDAKQRKVGYFEKADGGVLFLDEIGELPPALQVKLLRFIDERAFCRVGGTDPVRVDVQLVVATNRNLDESLEAGFLREDFYYRLRTLQIALPPLRTRKEDVLPIAEHFLDVLRGQGRTRLSAFNEKASHCLVCYDWPGNIRELKYAVERAVMFCDDRCGAVIAPEDLPLEMQFEARRSGGRYEIRLVDGQADVELEKARLELTYIQATLQTHGGSKDETWQALNYGGRHTMVRHIKKALAAYPELAVEFPKLSNYYGMGRER
jgi:two-component system NtrC family response regulator